jgi:hypothetical protein
MFFSLTLPVSLISAHTKLLESLIDNGQPNFEDEVTPHAKQLAPRL